MMRSPVAPHKDLTVRTSVALGPEATRSASSVTTSGRGRTPACQGLSGSTDPKT